jgi:GH24 family phage-related lysozyme (muramidase)
MLKRLNKKDFDDVPNQIKRWDKAGGKVLAGLVRRREAESLLFEGKEWQNV